MKNSVEELKALIADKDKVMEDIVRELTPDDVSDLEEILNNEELWDSFSNDEIESFESLLEMFEAKEDFEEENTKTSELVNRVRNLIKNEKASDISDEDLKAIMEDGKDIDSFDTDEILIINDAYEARLALSEMVVADEEEIIVELIPRVKSLIKQNKEEEIENDDLKKIVYDVVVNNNKDFSEEEINKINTLLYKRCEADEAFSQEIDKITNPNYAYKSQEIERYSTLYVEAKRFLEGFEKLKTEAASKGINVEEEYKKSVSLADRLGRYVKACEAGGVTTELINSLGEVEKKLASAKRSKNKDDENTAKDERKKVSAKIESGFNNATLVLNNDPELSSGLVQKSGKMNSPYLAVGGITRQNFFSASVDNILTQMQHVIDVKDMSKMEDRVSDLEENLRIANATIPNLQGQLDSQSTAMTSIIEEMMVKSYIRNRIIELAGKHEGKLDENGNYILLENKHGNAEWRMILPFTKSSRSDAKTIGEYRNLLKVMNEKDFETNSKYASERVLLHGVKVAVRNNIAEFKAKSVKQEEIANIAINQDKVTSRQIGVYHKTKTRRKAAAGFIAALVAVAIAFGIGKTLAKKVEVPGGSNTNIEYNASTEIASMIKFLNDHISELTPEQQEELNKIKAELAGLDSSSVSQSDVQAIRDKLLNVYNEALKTVNKNNSELKGDKEKLEAQLQSINGLLNKITDGKGNDLTVEQLIAEMDELIDSESTPEDLKAKIADVKTKLEDAQSQGEDYTGIVKSIAEIIKEFANNNLTVQGLSAEIEKLKEDIKNLENGDISGYLQQIKDLEDRIASLEASGEADKAEIDRLTKELDDALETITGLQGEKDDLTSQVEELTNTINVLEDQIADLNQTVEDLTAQGVADKATIDELKARLEELKDPDGLITKLEAEKAALEKENAELAASITEIENELKAQIAGLEEQLANMEAERDALKTEVEKLLAEITDVKNLSEKQDATIREVYEIFYGGFTELPDNVTPEEMIELICKELGIDPDQIGNSNSSSGDNTYQPGNN